MICIGVINIVEVGIPVYKARDVLSDALDSLVAQTYKKFSVCLSIDCDGEDYSDIISTYRARGLKIRVINGKINGGPGMARQRILDTTQASYLMYLDADDMLMPRAVEVLYKYVREQDYDILRSSFIRENKNTEDRFMSADDNLITWFHGKIYKVQYLRDKNIRFLPGLRVDEDAYFNAIAWNSTTKLGLMSEPTYIWRDNKSSITRKLDEKQYFINTHMSYIHGQIEALKYLFKINDNVSQTLITNTLINIYYYYVKAKFYKCDIEEMDNDLSTLKDEDWMQLWLNEGSNWVDVVGNIKGGLVVDEEHIIFFDEPFNLWAARLLRR